MKAIAIAGLVLLASVGAASAEDVLGRPKPKVPPNEVTVRIQVPDGASEEDVARGIAEEHARRDPAAQEAARASKQKAAANEAHHTRVDKVCDSIPEDSLERDASLRRMCADR